jgi:PAS domain S-box-containing protein
MLAFAALVLALLVAAPLRAQSSVNPELGLWETDRRAVLVIGAVLIGQLLLIGGLLVQRRRRQHSEGRTRAILRAMPDFMFLQTTDGVYVDYHSPDPGQLLFPPEQFLGRNMRDVLPPALVRAIEPAFAQAAVATEPVVVEYDLDLAQGTRRYEARLVRSNDQILTLVRDITEHERAEAALRESAQRYALATTAGAVGVWDWNFETNELYVDPRLKSLLGFEDAEISNRPEDWGSRVHPQDLPASTALVKACLDGDSDVYEIEHRMLHKDGSVKWVLSRGSTVRGFDGTLQRLVGTKVDITERKRAEEAVRENEAVLRTRNQEIQDLAGRLIAAQEVERARIARDLHDDLSQQLASLAIALSGVKRQVGALAGAGELQGDVAALQQRTLALAENIRRLSHDLHPSAIEHAGLVAALANYCKELQRRHTVVVTFRAEGDFESTAADSAFCLYRVAQEGLRNVVTHAHARHVAVRLVSTGDDAELTIVDDGRGFDIQAAKSTKGLGLISISERVRLAGGTVSIVTELNKGTHVRVQVPTHRSASSGAVSAGASGPYATTA